VQKKTPSTKDCFGYRHSSKYILLCSAEEEKFTQVWNNSGLSRQTFHLWVNYPLGCQK